MNTVELHAAVEAALRGEWEEAHTIVQKYEDETACWIHAVLHKIEGDQANSMYWYRRAGQTSKSSLEAKAELREIQTVIASQGSASE